MTHAVKKRAPTALVIKAFILVILVFTVIVPLVFLLPSLGKTDIGAILSSKNFLDSVLHSIATGLTATAISMLFAFLLAFTLARSRIRYKGIIAVVLTVPMLIPSISHGMGVLVLFGNNGLLTRLFGAESGLNGFWSIVLGSCLYAFPVAFLMFHDIFKYEDKAVYEAADILGISKLRQFSGITLPFLFKPLISIFFATFTLVFTDYGVAMMVGGRFMTLPLYMYKEVIGQLNFGVGAIVAIVLMLPAVGAFLFDIFNRDNTNSNAVSKPVEIKKNKTRDIVSYVFCAVSIAVVLLPIVVFSMIGFLEKYPTNPVFSFNNVLKAFDKNAGQFFGNSLLISLLVGAVGTAVAYFTGYLTARVPSKANKALHLISLLSLAIPGLVLGISYSLMFKGSFLMGTIAVLVLVNSVHFFSSPYLLAYNALNKVNKNYEIIAKTLQISKPRLCFGVIVPETLDTILEMFSYFFVNSMVTISAVSFLASSGNMPLSLLINEFEAELLIECASIVSLLILLSNGILKSVVYFVKRWRLIHAAR